MRKPCFESRVATLAAVALACLVATGCTAQFKRMPNRPLELAFDEGLFDVASKSDVAAESEEPLDTDMSGAPQAYAFDTFLALNDPDVVASSASSVRTAALTEPIRPDSAAVNGAAVNRDTVKRSADLARYVEVAVVDEPQSRAPVARHTIAQQVDKPITAIRVNIKPPGVSFPENLASGLFAQRPEVRFDAMAVDDATDGADFVYAWQSSAFCHRPLYFEQPNLERYGKSIGPLQSVLSGAHFFASVPALPYWMMVEHPQACCTYEDYGIDCIGPRQQVLPPARIGAAIAEGAAITGLILLIP